MTTNNLTEQWKKGELEQGYYYTRYTPSVGKPFVEIELRNYLIDLAKIRDAETVEILAPVPSYEECKCLETGIILADSLIKNTEAENQRLKSLLTDICCELVDDEEDMTNGLLQYFNTDVIDRIREVLQ